MKLYVSGPMTGIEDFNYPAFHAASAALRDQGYEVTSPAEQDETSGLIPGTSRWEDFVKWDLHVMLTCDAIALMEGWRRSRGARLEHFVAMEIGMTAYAILDYPVWCLRPL